MRSAKQLLNVEAAQPPPPKNRVEKREAKSLDHIGLRAEELKRGKQKRAATLSMLKAGSVFALFLSLVLQHDTVLFISIALLGCVGLGSATYLERER